ncbi:MAG: hypothetical protein HYT65_03610 [Candidatus Yanofskybacteria bacterium]|nr:hypothetical protein [Candidatus Yanofskybacteria bacterium]
MNFKRVLFLGFLGGLLLVALVISAQSANAQFCDEICQGQEDAYSIIRSARHRATRERTISSIERGVEQAIFRNGNYGYYGNSGVFVPTHDRNGRPIGRREGAITGAAIGTPIGAGVGAIFNRPGTGALLGAGGGALLGFVLSGRGQDSNRPVDCSKRKLNRKEQETCFAIASEQRAALAQEQVQAELAERQRTGRRLYNRTGFPVEVYDCDQLAATVRQGQSVLVSEAECGYAALMLVPDPNMPGVTVRRDAEFCVAEDMSGWIFTAPRRGQACYQ